MVPSFQEQDRIILSIPGWRRSISYFYLPAHPVYPRIYIRYQRFVTYKNQTLPCNRNNYCNSLGKRLYRYRVDTWTMVEADWTESALGEKPDAGDPDNCIVPVRDQFSSEKIKGQIQKPITGRILFWSETFFWRPPEKKNFNKTITLKLPLTK